MILDRNMFLMLFGNSAVNDWDQPLVEVHDGAGTS